MSKFIFFINPFFGHINPTLSLVRELVERGQIVIYYSSPPYRAIVEKVGAQYRCYKDPDGIFNWQLKHPVDSFDNDMEFIYKKIASVFAGPNQKMAQALYEEVKDEHPDYIIYDYFDGVWGKMAAEKLGVPAIASVPTFAICSRIFEFAPKECSRYFMLIPDEHINKLNINSSRLIHILSQRVASAFGEKNFNLFEYGNSEHLNIVYTSKYFQPYGDLFDEKFSFVGCTSYMREEKVDEPYESHGGKPLIYISLGTTEANKNINFYRACIEAFKNSNYYIVMSIGNNIDSSELGEIPSNFIVKNYVSQLKVLRSASLFLSHGGMNSTSEALISGVPLIIFPQQGDQFAVADRIKQLGAGISMTDVGVTVKNIREEADKVLSTPCFRENSMKIGKTIYTRDGLSKLIDYILNIKRA